jgi:hypothetical protein
MVKATFKVIAVIAHTLMLIGLSKNSNGGKYDGRKKRRC